MAQSHWDPQFPLSSVEQKARSARLDLPEVWQEVVAYYIEHWGCFGCALAVVPTLHGEEISLVQRRLELNGTLFYKIEVTEPMSHHFAHWLETWLPTIWGWRKDLSRVALMIEMTESFVFSPEGAQRSLLARRFPIPVLFAWKQGSDWRAWQERHDFLFPTGDYVLSDEEEAES